MSRYEIAARDREKHDAVIGWDKGLQTYFGQVIPKVGAEDWELTLWVGMYPKEINSVAELQEKMKDYVDIPKEMRSALELDQRLGHGPVHPLVYEHYESLTAREHGTEPPFDLEEGIER